MFSINIPLFLSRYTPKVARVIIFTFLEWTLISLLFLNCILFFLIVNFAIFFGLQTPCIHCSLSSFRISFNTLICNDHITRISKFKRAQRKRNKKETRGFDYIIYGPPWRIVKYAKNGNVIDKRIKRESGKDRFFFVQEGDQKPDFVKDNFMEPMHTRCIIDEERLIPVELIDEVTMEDSCIWLNQEKQHKREFTEKGSLVFLEARDGKTKLRNEARDGISVEHDSSRRDHVDERADNMTNQSQNTQSHSSLFEIAPVETTPFAKSEPPSPQHNEPEEHNKNKLSYSSKSLDSSFKINEGSIRGILHSQDQNTNSYQPIFQIAPIETTSPGIASEQISDKYDELDASLTKGNEEEIKDEFLIEFRESLEKFEKERCTIIEKLNKQVQKLFVIQKEKREYENMKEAKPNFQEDYKSLSDILNHDMNYSTNDLVSLGKGYNQIRNVNLKVKRHLPSFDVGTKEHEKSAIQGEIVKLREKLEQVNAEIKLIDKIVNSLQKRS